MASVCSRGAPAINQVTNSLLPGKLRNPDNAKKGRNCEILWENEFPFRGRTITRKWRQDSIWRLSGAEYDIPAIATLSKELPSRSVNPIRGHSVRSLATTSRSILERGNGGGWYSGSSSSPWVNRGGWSWSNSSAVSPRRDSLRVSNALATGLN
ncbi:hypothetical protein WN51_08423 [Melipona quadrifasciata]|uniref:Uncharacterized protein n=1 Tax=Melipona quadrifasciata TaxID=166423 RepID=A0A0M9AB70_9HYME|nr:hypothetical protein WN51_08423 [Melipona quadrifasciata]